ncbi:hypothetical protein JCM19240_6398 [Vibrio maritimus]|uniref:Uncharacterized protein n=1 Tax=Vibrio maritimus TaxID=990268 RepID=A0A090SZ84_9VIBR|nr:hypothetical protein JCM19240_6398 [Vibrio maritimus]
MKKLVVALITLLVACGVKASEGSSLSLSRGIVVHVVNGKAVDKEWLVSQQLLTLPAGANQILVTLEQPIPYNTMKEKHRSNPIVLEFALAKGESQLSYRLFRDKADARKFEQSLDFTLLDASDSLIDFEATVLHASGFVGFEDFLKLIDQHNQN